MKEKDEFLSRIESELNRLEFQHSRIFENSTSISPMHDADFYIVLLRRLYRQLEKVAGYDSRVANLNGEYRDLVVKIKIRDHFEHEIDLEKLQSTDVTGFPEFKNYVFPAIANVKIVTSVFINKDSAFIMSGNFKWDLYKDHKMFINLIKKFASFYPFSKNKLMANINLRKFKKYLGVVGLTLNLLGSMMVIIAIGGIPCTSSTTCDGVTYKLAYVLYPTLLKLGLGIIIFGFILQLIKEYKMKK